MFIIKLLPKKPEKLVVSGISPQEKENIPLNLDKISIFFNRLPKPEEIKITIFPEIRHQTIFTENRLNLKLLEKLKPEEKYIIEIYHSSGEFLYSFSFETEKPTQTLSNPQFLPQKIEEMNQKYPLLPHLPLRSENFDIDYLGPLKLQVLLKKGTKEEVLNWIRSKGVDPTTHQIEWLSSEE